MDLRKRLIVLRFVLYPFLVCILLLHTFFLEYPPIPLRQSLFTKLLLALIIFTIFESFSLIMSTNQKPMKFIPSAKKTLQRFWFIISGLYLAIIIIGLLMVQDELLLGLLFGVIIGFATLLPVTVGIILFSFMTPYLKPILMKKFNKK